MPPGHGGQRPQHRRHPLLPLQPSGADDQRRAVGRPQRPGALDVGRGSDPPGRVDRGRHDPHAGRVGAEHPDHLGAHGLGVHEHHVRTTTGRRREGLHRSAFAGVHEPRHLAVQAPVPTSELAGVHRVDPAAADGVGDRASGVRGHPVVRVHDDVAVGRGQGAHLRHCGCGERVGGAQQVAAVPRAGGRTGQRHPQHPHAVGRLGCGPADDGTGVTSCPSASTPTW